MSGFYWLASYPKSGNTWMRLFLESLLTDGKTPDINKLTLGINNVANRDLFDCILDIESSELIDEEILKARPAQYEIEAREAKAPLIRKVHDAWRFTPSGVPLFPPELTLGAIYLVRDPRDVALSFAHHASWTVDRTIKFMADPEAELESSNSRITSQLAQKVGSWSMHCQSWLDAPIPKLLLRYEDMVSDPLAGFSEVASFLRIETEQENVESAIAAVHFDRLRKFEEAYGFSEKPPGMEHFFRKGVLGGWKESLNKEQIARIEADHGAVMKKLGYLL